MAWLGPENEALPRRSPFPQSLLDLRAFCFPPPKIDRDVEPPLFGAQIGASLYCLWHWPTHVDGLIRTDVRMLPQEWY